MFDEHSKTRHDAQGGRPGIIGTGLLQSTTLRDLCCMFWWTVRHATSETHLRLQQK